MIDHENELTLLTWDSLGTCPDTNLLGQVLKHTRNGKLYIIHGFCWIGQNDEWGFLHEELRDDGTRGVTIVRPLYHIRGYTNDGEPRYAVLPRVEKNLL